MFDTFHLPRFGPKDNFFTLEQISKDLEDYINSSKKDISSLSKLDEETIEKLWKPLIRKWR
jgi:hypothetical protein